MKKNAVDCARESGFEAITCGHTHYVEDSVYKGVRYINTGTWTEEPLHYVSICPDTIRLANYVPHAPIDVDTAIPVTLNHDEFDREAM